MIVGLVVVNDADVLDGTTILTPDVCAPDDQIAVREIRDLINRFSLDFDYLASPRSAAEIEGKSSAFTDMLRKRYTDPVRRAECRRAYAVALARILDDNKAYTLTKACAHELLDRLRQLLNARSNPGSG